MAAAAIPLGIDGEVPSSAQKKIRERYTVSEDGKTLLLDYTVEDPVYLTKPFSDRVLIERLRDDAEMYEFKCDANTASRFTGAGRSKDSASPQNQTPKTAIKNYLSVSFLPGAPAYGRVLFRAVVLSVLS